MIPSFQFRQTDRHDLYRLCNMLRLYWLGSLSQVKSETRPAVAAVCCYCVPSQTLFVALCRNLAIVSCQTERPLQMVSSCREKHSGDMLSSSFSLFVPQSLLCAGTYRPRRWASIWIHELSLKSCAADGRPSIWYIETRSFQLLACDARSFFSWRSSSFLALSQRHQSQ